MNYKEICEKKFLNILEGLELTLQNIQEEELLLPLLENYKKKLLDLDREVDKIIEMQKSLS